MIVQKQIQPSIYTVASLAIPFDKRNKVPCECEHFVPTVTI